MKAGNMLTAGELVDIQAELKNMMDADKSPELVIDSLNVEIAALRLRVRELEIQVAAIKAMGYTWLETDPEYSPLEGEWIDCGYVSDEDPAIY
jgi:hypothetical protein